MIKLQIKDGVSFLRPRRGLGDTIVMHTIQPEILAVLPAVLRRFEEVGTDVVITSALDGTHSANSLHYTGFALDFRIRHLAHRDQAAAIVAHLRRDLGADYDVLLESTHIHIEFDPD